MRVGDEREHGQVTSIVPTESAKTTPKGRTPGASAAVRHGRPARTAPAALAPRAGLLPALAAVYRAQLSRARVARIPLLFVATFQSVGIMVLMRGVVDGGSEARAVVAGSSVLGAAGAYASFTVPGTIVTAVAGSALFGLPMTHLWVLVAVIPLSGAALSGLGAALGLLAPRQELATLLGQLGMSAALLLGVLPAERMPAPIGWARDLLPSTYGVEALSRSFDAHPDWGMIGLFLAVCAVVGVLSLAVATWAY